MNARENSARFNQRLVRLFVWISLMAVAFFVTMQIDLRKTIFVPMVFLPLMLPMVLMPLSSAKKAKKLR